MVANMRVQGTSKRGLPRERWIDTVKEDVRQ